MRTDTIRNVLRREGGGRGQPEIMEIKLRPNGNRKNPGDPIPLRAQPHTVVESHFIGRKSIGRGGGVGPEAGVASAQHRRVTPGPRARGDPRGDLLKSFSFG